MISLISKIQFFYYIHFTCLFKIMLTQWRKVHITSMTKIKKSETQYFHCNTMKSVLYINS